MIRFIKKASKFCLTLLLTIGWVFSGWPQINVEVGTLSFRFPAEIPRAFATITASSTTITTSGYSTVFVSANACQTSIAAWGAGGGGATGASAQGGGGGGGGAFASSTITTTPGDTLRIFIAPSVALETRGATTTASSTVPTLIVGASGGNALLAAVGALGGLGSIGDVTKNGGDGGAATTGSGDESGGGGAAAGPHGVGGNGGSCNGTTTVGCGGGGGNGGGSGTNNTVTAGTAGPNAGGGGAGGNGACGNGTDGTGGTYGGGGGGGGDDLCAGANGAAPGGGGGGGELSGGTGAAGQMIITEFVDDAGCSVPPTVTTNFANPGATTASLYGTKTGGENGTEHGFAYGTDATLAVAATTTLGALTSNSSFSSGIGGLIVDTVYFFRAYVTGATDRGYGVVKSFTTGNTTAVRTVRLFEGFSIKFLNGRIILY